MSKRSRKREKLRASQLRRARLLEHIDPCDPRVEPPDGAVLADHAELTHNNTYSALPRFYVDRVIVCRDCGTEEVWPARRQQWWYETAKGSIFSDAVYCRSCREKRRAVRDEARAVHLSGVAAKRKRGGE